MSENLAMALSMMWKGMLGVFVVIILITLVVIILGRIATNKKQ